ncbi:DegT/DnrJ/EryC1/StrS family aminotransferase [Herbaspirillum sp. RTI4]|uniref:DegT/DnrJ/EryC1/StrS family aminotransferase n=1 Tax=Herbaspirillum sp. RTI4 TaxID=3048640 RepID=UPI002AB3B904|nr:DegT/DnrJ/EryC1/StrS family aminotransferase [Herbaspirillum sp. RTI4]MDY7577047.1 DegT/DnrJ/EryC1/StrS family aminotransferase [Herbaspirillum sp. RTI4]MEA9982227.1 DegT/DnrJ/EryC1/StrS family aminotransferase [Herbaspirillum sp. RTI4]
MMNTHLPIYLYEQFFDQAETDAVALCMSRERFNDNIEINEFQAGFSQKIGVPHSIAVANGSCALHLTMLTAGITAGDEVIVPSLTFVATANAVSYTGAQAIFADVNPDTWQMGAAEVEPLITSRTKAIIAVHLYGHACPLRELQELAERHHLLLIEDCAEALGTTYAGEQVGIHADAAIFSFYKNKTITTGEGGMVITRHANWHEHIVKLKSHGMPLDRRFWYEMVGYNYRMTNVSAAIGIAQLAKLDQFIARKRNIRDQYQKELRNLPIVFQAEVPDSASACWLISMTLSSESVRDALAQFLLDRQIQSRPVFLPVQRFPMYADATWPTPAADRIAECGLSLPSWPGLSDPQIDIITNAIQLFFAETPT